VDLPADSHEIDFADTVAGQSRIAIDEPHVRIATDLFERLAR
jgi:hypothetical protein